MNDFTATANVIAERLAGSELFRNYRDAFLQTTGMRLSFEPVSCHRGDLNIPSVARFRLPVKAGEAQVGAVTMQPVAVSSPAFRSFDDVARVMLDDGKSAAEVRAAQEAFGKLPVVENRRFLALQTLVATLTTQLSEFAERLFLQATESEPAAVRKARAFIMSHLGESMTLEEVSSHAGVSPFHFCKVFKRASGFTFTEFVSRARVQQAKHLLLKPSARVTEVAYDVGFQSLSQFNRSFRRVTSQSPTEYRNKVGRSQMAPAAA